PGAAIFLIALSGACLGFLRFNFNPASIFLGDSGSLFLGYILATASVIGVLKSTIFLSLLIPIMILGIPIYDTASVMMRRIRHGDHIFSADKKHLHHRLLNRGFSHRQTVLSIYLACFLLGIGSLALTFLNIYAAVLVIFIIVAVAFYEIRRIKRNVNRYASEESS
ncbi:MAG: MraY family glycosyltransferase, partial [Candidatus Margulisiibacteriota bacterium]